jgi:hypothetical protein
MPLLRKIMRRFLIPTIKITVTLISISILGLVGLFCYGLIFFPELHPPPYEAPQAFGEILWAEVGGGNPIPERSAGIVLVLSEVFNALAGSSSPPLPQGTPASTLAHFVAKDAMRDAPPGQMKMLKRHLVGFVGGAWIASKWTPHQMLAYLSTTLCLGHGFYGVQAASHGYFGSPAESLTVSQMALLVAILKSPNRYDPWCAPERTLGRVNNIIGLRNLDMEPVTSIDALGVLPAPDGACKQK